MSEQEIYRPSEAFREGSLVRSFDQYKEMYDRSVSNPEGFWAEQAERLTWFEPFEQVKNTSFASDSVSIKWYEGGKLNVSYNCIDRHLPQRAEQTALIFEPDDPADEAQYVTYAQLLEEVSRLANVMKSHGVEKGDRVTIYLPMIPEAAYAMLACSRIGAIHSVVFAGFSPNSLSDRILDCDSTYLITADEGLRGSKRVPLKANADPSRQ